MWKRTRLYQRSLRALLPQNPLDVPAQRGYRVGAARYHYASVLVPRTIVEPMGEFCRRVSVHQDTAVIVTSPFYKACPTRHAAMPALEVQRLSLRAEIHTRPGMYKGVPRQPTRSEYFASPPRTSRVASRAHLPPSTHPKCDFLFARVPVGLTPRQV